MCEPLRGKLLQVIDDVIKPIENRPYKLQFCFRKEDVKSAVEFYIRYRDRTDLLISEKPKIFDNFLEINKNASIFDVAHPHIPYNRWLFGYCFWDVIE